MTAAALAGGARLDSFSIMETAAVGGSGGPVRIPEHFRERQGRRAGAIVAVNVAVILLAGPIAWWVDRWWAYVAAVLLVGARAQALYILQHEAMHWLLFDSRRLNDIVGVAISGLLGTRLFEGRRIHFQHHRRVGTAEDPNVVWHRTDGREPGVPIVRFMALQLVGGRLLPVVARLFALAGRLTPETAGASGSGAPGADPGRLRREARIDLGGVLVAQAVVFVGVSLVASPWCYVLLYFAPIVTLTCLFEAVRSFSEHVLPGAARNAAEADRCFYMRAGPVERFFISQFDFHFHHVHHLHQNVPTFKVAALHEWLRVNDPTFAGRYLERPGYLGTLYLYGRNRPFPGAGEGFPARGGTQ